MDGVFSEREDDFRSLFSDTSIRAFHATRLLPHEERDVRHRGLRVLTEGLVIDRIERAVDAGGLSRKTADRLLRSHVFTHEWDHREGQVCFFLSRYVLARQVGAVSGLLRYWGGEAMSMSSKSLEHRDALEQLGRPAIVAADLDLSGSRQTHRISRTSPGLCWSLPWRQGLRRRRVLRIRNPSGSSMSGRQDTENTIDSPIRLAVSCTRDGELVKKVRAPSGDGWA
jgi:hypothetical protein